MSSKHSARFKDFGRALDRNTVVAALLPVVRERFGENAEISQVVVTHLLKRVFTCGLMISGSNKAPDIFWPVIAKAFSNTELFIREFNLMQTLWENGFSREAEDGISIAEPLLLAKDINFLFMEMVPGMKVRKLIKGSGNHAGDMRRFARTLAKLHRCSFMPAEKITVQSEFQIEKHNCSVLIEAFPGLRDLIQFIVESSQRMGNEFGTDIFTPVHTDYNLGNVHIEGKRSWLIDVGNVRYGDPALDVGNVLALALLNNEKPSLSGGPELLEVFTTEYFSIMDKAIAHRVPLYEALNLLFRACKYYHSQDSSRSKKIDGLIERAVACIERMD